MVPSPTCRPSTGGQGRFKMIELLGQEGLTLAQIAHRMLLARGHLTMIGTAESIADEMERWFAGEA